MAAMFGASSELVNSAGTSLLPLQELSPLETAAAAQTSFC
jgi:hypothetical protein